MEPTPDITDHVRYLWVFDFDDTLVVTDARIRVTNARSGKSLLMAPHELQAYSAEADDVFDYSEFGQLTNPRPIDWMVDLVKFVSIACGKGAVRVLSARHAESPIKQFLASQGLGDISVTALGNIDPDEKARCINGWIGTEQVDVLTFFDDSRRNVAKIASLARSNPQTKIVAYLVEPDRLVQWTETSA